jgi:hypothetical protein
MNNELKPEEIQEIEKTLIGYCQDVNCFIVIRMPISM